MAGKEKAEGFRGMKLSVPALAYRHLVLGGEEMHKLIIGNALQNFG